MAFVTISTRISIDNENGAGTGLPDNDLGISGNWRAANNTHVEFRIPLPDAGDVESASLTIVAIDVDVNEEDKVWLNGVELGFLTKGLDGAELSTQFTLNPALPDSNLIQVANVNAVQNPADPWTFAVKFATLTTKVDDSDAAAGTIFADVLVGDGENNRFAYSDGKDSYDGGGGAFDIIFYDLQIKPVLVKVSPTAPSTVFLGGVGEDTIQGIEGMSGGLANDTITAQVAIGQFGDDLLSGTTDLNFLDGFNGSDTADYRNKMDKVVVVLPATDDDLEPGATPNARAGTQRDILVRIENVWGGVTGDNLTGNDTGNKLNGFGGADTLNGATGADLMRGGRGNDTYFADNTGDKAIEVAGQGAADLVRSSVNFTLGDHVEQLTLTGAADLRGNGNGIANLLTGNAGKNVLNGRVGADTVNGAGGNDNLNGEDGQDRLDGGNGNDTIAGGNAADSLDGDTGNDKLSGQAGADTIVGGVGRDTLSGGAEGDTFRFLAFSHLGLGAAARDVVTDFQVALDRIDVSTLDAKAGTPGVQNFDFIGTAAFTAEGQIRAVKVGANTLLLFNRAGPGGTEFDLLLQNLAPGALLDGNFLT